jgi:hypothetical protein
MTKDAWDAYYRGEDSILDKNTNEYVSYKTFYERERDRYFNLRENAFQWIRSHENEKDTDAYNLIHQTFILAGLKVNEAILKLNEVKDDDR